jgi:hypothetical protein
MKIYKALIPLFLSMFSLTIPSIKNFDIIVKSKWRNLDNNNEKIVDFGGKWVLVGSITFKKRVKEPIAIDTITLRWNGEPITNLIASLYKKNFSKNFIPIEENLVCDGLWNKTKQSIIFNFDEKETLAPTTTFYVVLTIPDDLEDILKKGTLCIEEQCLPKPFKEHASSASLSLAIHGTPPSTLHRSA